LPVSSQANVSACHSCLCEKRLRAGVKGRPLDLAEALIKLSKENLANLHPHPLYAAFYYSHPPVVERVRRLQEQSSPDTS
ncbi:MAG: hypothetical protein P8X67_14230, partial [Syntrophobacterales bacterium]